MARIVSDSLNYSYNGVALEGTLNEVTMNMDVAEAEITAFSDAWQNFLAGKKNIVTEIRGTASQTAASGERILVTTMGSGAKSTVLDIAGASASATSPHYKTTASGLTGSYIARVRVSIAPGDVGTYEATIQHSGATTRATS